jgi:hypothetical protein
VKVAVVALACISVGATIAGCGSRTTPQPVNLSSAQSFATSIAARMAAAKGTGDPSEAVRYKTVEYSAVVDNPGTPGAFTAFVTYSQTITVKPSSAAIISTVPKGTLTFTTASDRQRWVASGSPSLEPANRTWSTASGQFSFLPVGSNLTYRQAAALPAAPRPLATAILNHLRAYAGSNPSAMLVLRQLGYLIATAPLSAAARAAAWHVVASLPGLYLCGTATDLTGRRGEALCANANGEETQILIDANTGSVLAIQQRLTQTSPLYPSVGSGTLIGSSTILSS